MLKAAREALAARVLELAGGESEVVVGDVDRGLTRFTQNAIHQNVAATNTTLRVRTVESGRTGVAATNVLGDEGIAATVARAKAIAALAPRDDEAPEIQRSHPVPAPAAAYDGATADAAPERRARIASDIFSVAERDGFWAAGYVSTERHGVTIANTRGTLASFDGTVCALNVKANGAASTGFAEYYGNAVGAIDGSELGAVAAAKVRLGSDPQTVAPGNWTVILEPPAFGELLSYLCDHFSAQSYEEGSSFLSGGLERRYASENVTLLDDHAHPLFAGIPFDDEGVPTQKVPLLERGIARNVVTDARYAKRLGLPNTGHALPAPNAHGPQVRHLVVASGEKSLERLIAETARGLLISRFWYIRPVDHRRTIVTGMTRDGTFLIENGALVGGVRNLRFNQSILAALSSVEFSDRQVRSGGYSYRVVTPAAKIESFAFTSTTDF
jgi:predicted Zn-dependent protease